MVSTKYLNVFFKVLIYLSIGRSGYAKLVKDTTMNPKNSIFNIFKPRYDFQIIYNKRGLKDIMETAYIKSKNLRCIGSGWSWNSACFGKITIKLRGDFLKINPSLNRKTVVVGAGAMVVDIGKSLLKNKLQMISIGFCLHKNESQTAGGVCSTNVHHTNTKPFSETVKNIWVMRYDKHGRVEDICINKSDRNFKFYFGTIGTCGIIYKVEFAVQEAGYYRYENYLTQETKVPDIIRANCLYISSNQNSWNTFKFTKINKPCKNNKCITNTLSNFREDLTIRAASNIINPKTFSFIYTEIPIISDLIQKYTKFLDPFDYDDYDKILIYGKSNLGFQSDYTHIEIELYIKVSDYEKALRVCRKNKIIYGYVLALRYVPKIRNSIFTFDEDMITFSYQIPTVRQEYPEELYTELETVLGNNNIDFYPHFGKFVGRGRTFDDYFSRRKKEEYKRFRKKHDPKCIFDNRFSIY